MNISGMITGIMPYLSYIVNLFNKLLELFSSYVGVDITLPTTQPAEPSDDEPVEG